MAEQADFKKAKCLCLDIETSRQDSLQLWEIGVYRPDIDARERISGKAADLIPRLNKLTQGATFVLGHNIIAFDQPALSLLHPSLALRQLPLLDTLELSPLAFPLNPYHHLIKDYKLCSASRNDPVRDAELAYQLFIEQADAFKQRIVENADEVLCLHYLLTLKNGKGVANFFATLRRALRPAFPEVQAAWQRVCQNKICLTGQKQLFEHYLPDPAWHKTLAYALAWLRVSGGNSVLPPWVSLAYPKTKDIIALLRDIPCTDPECDWCQEQHDLLELLPKYFPGIQTFRPTPSTPEGKSLQQVIVENGFAGKSSLAILPTGGGKSLCYQLPALAHYYRNSSLTVIISPLQSLMKDQVDNLESRGISCAGYLNSLLNPLERRVMLDKLRLGDLGLIFIAPEQFRSTAFTKALQYREIGAWVFDEAHCLSKWGHDFRPDYLYVSRFIKSRQKDKPSPVFCFTATAKPDVVQDICAHFQKQLGITLECLMGGVSRENLAYEVHAVPAPAKYPEVLRLLREDLQENGGAIVFCARQKTVEEMAEFLQQAGLECGFFHGGMLPEKKRQVQEAFIGGELRVIAATNAFGMGVDKADVRLVIHLDTPGSLENYLQEAGRAGRDQAPARCILLFDDTDLDVQFRLIRNSRLTQHDIASILKALRSIEKKDRSEGSVAVTSGEILLEIPDKHSIDPDAADADTKVRIAVSWLEEARLLERHENHTRVYPGSLLVSNLDEARKVLEKKLGPKTPIEAYLQLLSYLFASEEDVGVSTDELMLATGRQAAQVLDLLRDLDRFKLLSNDTEIGIILYREPDTCVRIAELRKLEDALLACLREVAPDADQQEWQILNVRRLCDTLRRDAGVALTPDKLTRLLKSFAEPFGDSAARRGFFTLRPAGLDNRYMKLLRNWQEIDIIRQRRMQLAQALVSYFLERRQGNNLLVSCKQGILEADLQADITLQDMEIRDWNTALALASTLLYLDCNEVLHVSRGKAVFRAAMTIQLNSEARRRQFKNSDYTELALHYKDKIIQVHVMAEYARLALDKIQAAMSFIFDYFGMDRDEFVRRYFAGRKEILDMATTEAAHKRILTELQNPEQQAIVSAPKEDSYLVLAGPGSGKTKVIVHRIAWLLREAMVMPEEIMVLTYNRSAACEIRQRLWALVGPDAGGVSVQTLHSLAMRLTGTSYAVAIERGETIQFDTVIRLATAQLRQAELDSDLGATLQRERLLSGLRFLLVDEYQDINADHYALTSALAGRALNNQEDKLALLVVGDDDQNIYTFSGANVRFIKQFTDDYQAKNFYLTENYRSTTHIINAANRVIAPARERMKTRQAIRINHVRRDMPAGGEFAALDTLAQGRVHILETPTTLYAEVTAALAELDRLLRLPNPNQPPPWGRCAVIARRWETLEPLAALCKLQSIPLRLMRDDTLLELHTTREAHCLLSLLKSTQRQKARVLLRWGSLSRWFRKRFKLRATDVIEHPYRAMLAQFIGECEVVAPQCPLLVSDITEALYDFHSGSQSVGSEAPNAPLLLLTAHRAKGLEFDHVLILDGGGWQVLNDEERRLFYVAMTRARKTLTLCSGAGHPHVFIRNCAELSFKSQAPSGNPDQRLALHTWVADPKQVILSWPGYFARDKPIHQAIAKLEYGDALQLRVRSDGKLGWELTDMNGETISRMAQVFKPPDGEITAVRVAAILVRSAKAGEGNLRCDKWEVVLPEIEFLDTDSQ